MQPGDIFALVVLLFALVLGWSLSRGHSLGIPLYALSVVIAIALLGGSIAELLGADAVTASLNIAAIALALAGLLAHPTLWHEQMQNDLRGTRVVQAYELRDVLSWRGWLKLVDRVGALRAALLYFALQGIAIVAALATTYSVHSADRTIYTAIAALAPASFAVLTTTWIYRGARQLVPGA